MKRFLVPTDFSDTSKNAARYAAALLNGKDGAMMTLYYVYDTFTAGSDGSPLSEDDQDRNVILNQALGNIRQELQEISQVKIEIRAEAGSSLIENIDRIVRHEDIDMVIMGITGATPLEQIFMGSNTLKLVDRGICPVLIVPPEAKFENVKNVCLCSDFHDVDSTMPFQPIISVLELFKANLHIINVDSEHYVEITEAYKKEKDKLESRLKAYNPQFTFMRLFDFQDAIHQFAIDNHIDVILTFPKQHSFIGSLFKASHTRKMAYHSTVPILAIHE